MKDIVRLRTSIKEDIEQILNQQIQMEFESSSKYLAMASWCDRNGFEFSAGFFYKQSDEERQHGLKIFHYLCDQGVVAITPAVGAVQIEFDTLRSVFEAALEQEITVTNAINRIIATCRRENDYITEEFLRWYVERADGRRIHCPALSRSVQPYPGRRHPPPRQRTCPCYLHRRNR